MTLLVQQEAQNRDSEAWCPMLVLLLTSWVTDGSWLTCFVLLCPYLALRIQQINERLE